MAKKKTPKKIVLDELEVVGSCYTYLRDNFTCQMCEKTNLSGVNCQYSHVESRAKDGRLKYDPLNAKVLCYHCHMHVWHKNPRVAAAWFNEKFPERASYLDDKLANRPLGSIPIGHYEDQRDWFVNKLLAMDWNKLEGRIGKDKWKKLNKIMSKYTIEVQK